MMNPYLQVPPKQAEKARKVMNDELTAGQYAEILSKPAPRRNLGLWIGSLLIRMGNRLAQQDVEMKTSKEHA
jgi:hypothetical protein